MILFFSALSWALERVQPFDIEGTKVDPGQVHTPKNTWVILDETTSAGDEPTDLAVTERTYQDVVTAIAAAASGDGEISIFDIPRSWNAIRFRAVGITDGNADTFQIYLGTLGAKNAAGPSVDCELAYLGQLAFTIGTQESIYAQVAFTSGGTQAIEVGDTITGNVSGNTAIVTAVGALTSGAWADGDAAGTLQVRSPSGPFQAASLSLTKAGETSVISANVATIGGDLVDFELADTLVVTESDWAMSVTTKSPTGNRVAETTVDLMGADIMVIVPTAAAGDCKLLGKGY